MRLVDPIEVCASNLPVRPTAARRNARQFWHKGRIARAIASKSFLFVFAIVACSSNPCPASVLAYWRFEEGAPNNAASGIDSILDSVGGFHGTPLGGPLYRADTPVSTVPKTGAANNLSMELVNGSSDYISFADPTGALNPSGAFTVEFWMKSDPSTQPSSLAVIIDHSHGFVDSTGWAFQLNNVTGTVGFAIGQGGAGSGNFNSALSTTALNDSQWHHLAGVYDPSSIGQEVKLFVDGSLEAMNSASTFFGNTRDVSIGRSFTDQRYYDGFIDEVRISDAALSPNEFLNAAGNAVPEPSTIVTWCGIAGVGLILTGLKRKRTKRGSSAKSSG